MPMYEVKTTYREVQFGKCWLTVEAADKDAAIIEFQEGNYEWEDYKCTDVEDFEIDADVISIEEIT